MSHRQKSAASPEKWGFRRPSEVHSSSLISDATQLLLRCCMKDYGLLGQFQFSCHHCDVTTTATQVSLKLPLTAPPPRLWFGLEQEERGAYFDRLVARRPSLATWRPQKL